MANIVTGPLWLSFKPFMVCFVYIVHSGVSDVVSSSWGLCHEMVKWNTASVSQVNTLGMSSSVSETVFDLMKSSDWLPKLQQTAGWFPTVQCTHLEAGSKQIMPQAEQLGTSGSGQRHRTDVPACWCKEWLVSKLASSQCGFTCGEYSLFNYLWSLLVFK